MLDSVPTVVPDGWFSLTVLFERETSVGASLALVTVSANGLAKVVLPSSVRMRTV